MKNDEALKNPRLNWGFLFEDREVQKVRGKMRKRGNIEF